MIEFKVDSHTYTDEEKNEYTSVTTVIKRYKTFDAIKVSEKYAIKHPQKTAEGWRDEWEKIGDEAADYGTMIHKEEEDKVRAQCDCREAAKQVDKNTIRSLDSLKNLPNGFYPEMLIWNEQLRIAGQVDLVHIENGVVNIIDYKTYKKVEEKSFYNWKTKKWTVMRSPLQGLMDCNVNHAGLQLSLYAAMLEELGYKIGKLSMLHINREGVKTPYKLPYNKYRFFVKIMLHDFIKKANDGSK
jgi:ATP-dependent exoDNAse (exonuclease V) beta subunit